MFLGVAAVWLIAAPATASDASINGASLDLLDGWLLHEQVDAISLQSFTVVKDEMVLVVATGPVDGDTTDEVYEFAQDRLDSILPMLLEDHRRTKLKIGKSTARGHKGIGTTDDGVDVPIECAAAVGDHNAVAVCAAAQNKSMRKEVKPLCKLIALGAADVELGSTSTLAFEGVDLPVPTGWNAALVEGEILPFAYLSQRHGGSVRLAKLPSALAAIEIPWDKVSNLIAAVLAGPHGGSRDVRVEPGTVAGTDCSLVSFRMTIDDREGWVVLAHPVGRRDLALLGISRSADYRRWFDDYLETVALNDTESPPLEMPAEGDLMESLEQVVPGASELLLQYIENLQQAREQQESGSETEDDTEDDAEGTD